MRKSLRGFLLAGALCLIVGVAFAASLPPIQPVAHVDLPRYMGKWYLIATIPTRYGNDSYNAVETYTLKPDGDIHTTFHFNEGAFNGPLKDMTSTGYVKSGSGNAVWSVKVFGPFKAQYIVAYLNPDCSQVIIARDKRDYVWVMARTPEVSQADYDTLVRQVDNMGYDLSKLRKVPQRWPDGASASQ